MPACAVNCARRKNITKKSQGKLPYKYICNEKGESGMFYPKNAEELKTIIRDAAAQGMPLVPVSSGAPHIHNASVNTAAETVSFEKMNKVMDIDRRARFVRVESGVTFGELIPSPLTMATKSSSES